MNLIRKIRCERWPCKADRIEAAIRLETVVLKSCAPPVVSLPVLRLIVLILPTRTNLRCWNFFEALRRLARSGRTSSEIVLALNGSAPCCLMSHFLPVFVTYIGYPFLPLRVGVRSPCVPTNRSLPLSALRGRNLSLAVTARPRGSRRLRRRVACLDVSRSARSRFANASRERRKPRPPTGFLRFNSGRYTPQGVTRSNGIFTEMSQFQTEGWTL